jgi:uncharacterized protein YeaO (DUF488 family)
MTLRIVQLGTPRAKDEGLRVGTVRRPPRGVPKAKFASQNWYDVWYPNLAPSVPAMKQAQAAETPAQWAAFVKKFRATTRRVATARYCARCCRSAAPTWPESVSPRRESAPRSARAAASAHW